MKKSISYLAFITFIMIFCLGCNEESSLLEENSETTKKEFTFIYKGVSYSSEYKENEDSIILLNDELNSFMNKLSTMPKVATVFHDDGSIEFFDSGDEVLKQLSEGNLFKKDLETRAAIPTTYYLASTRLEIYASKNFGGETLGWNNSVEASILYPRPPLAGVDMDNRMSSFKFSATFSPNASHMPPRAPQIPVVTFWTDRNFAGNSFWYSLNVNTPIYNGARIPKNFNDKVSSLKVVWTN